MNKVIPILLFSILFSGQPPIKTDAQRMKVRDSSELRATRDKLFIKAFSNQDTIVTLIKKKKKRRVITKPVYVKVYKTVPIYVPIVDSLAYVTRYPDDTLSGRYMIEDLDLNKTLPKKKSFLNRIFNKK